MTRKKHSIKKRVKYGEKEAANETLESVMALSLNNSAQYQFLFDSFKSALLHSEDHDSLDDPFKEMQEVFKTTHATGLRFDDTVCESLRNRINSRFAKFRNNYTFCNCNEPAEFVSFQRKTCRCKTHSNDLDYDLDKMIILPCSSCSESFAVSVCFTCASNKPVTEAVFCESCLQAKVHIDKSQTHFNVYFEDLLSNNGQVNEQTQRLKDNTCLYLSKLKSYLCGPVSMMISTEKEVIIDVYEKLKRVFMVFFNLRAAVYGVLNKEIDPAYHSHLCDEVEKCLSMSGNWIDESIFSKSLDYKQYLITDSNYISEHFWLEFSSRLKPFEIKYLDTITSTLKSILDYNEAAFFSDKMKILTELQLDALELEENPIMINLIVAEVISITSVKPNLLASIPNSYSSILFDKFEEISR